MKKVLTILLIFLMLALMLVSCGRRKTPGTIIIPSKTETTKETPGETSETPTEIETTIDPVETSDDTETETEDRIKPSESDTETQQQETETEEIDYDLYNFKHEFKTIINGYTTEYITFKFDTAHSVAKVLSIRVINKNTGEEIEQLLTDSGKPSGTYIVRESCYCEAYYLVQAYRSDVTKEFGPINIACNLIQITTGDPVTGKIVSEDKTTIYIQKESRGTFNPKINDSIRLGNLYYTEDGEYRQYADVYINVGEPVTINGKEYHPYYTVADGGHLEDGKVYVIPLGTGLYSFTTESTELELVNKKWNKNILFYWSVKRKK